MNIIEVRFFEQFTVANHTKITSVDRSIFRLDCSKKYEIVKNKKKQKQW